VVSEEALEVQRGGTWILVVAHMLLPCVALVPTHCDACVPPSAGSTADAGVASTPPSIDILAMINTHTHTHPHTLTHVDTSVAEVAGVVCVGG
jgi:hypothetical protein